MVYITRALVEVLCNLASDAEPNQVTTGVSVSPARYLEGAWDLPPETPVFTDFYFPTDRNSVNAVFGVDLATPARSAEGRFVSHPTGELQVTKRDDLSQVIFVAVPPWTSDGASFAAFDRFGSRRELEIVDAAPPELSPSGDDG
ncbi:hypothetical protein [Natrarchaeobaculum aegyptiacum]|uniref:Uncharacterized protein n=1 Tax=Natrarchaeobaculum aegyptiacum TaxID=745377 RepID=A0A2Z2HTZ4_9EURY|nr:hypothetical protein [Natrarchaeobaculum aegyptiacum]ARS90680.1 hypothetical protein B1756_13715 [Natrarchaeobaculum aegyptiacum]